MACSLAWCTTAKATAAVLVCTPHDCATCGGWLRAHCGLAPRCLRHKANCLGRCIRQLWINSACKEHSRARLLSSGKEPCWHAGPALIVAALAHRRTLAPDWPDVQMLPDLQPCFANRLAGASGGRTTQGWRCSSQTASAGAGKFGSAKLPIATTTKPGKLSLSQYTVEPQPGQK